MNEINKFFINSTDKKLLIKKTITENSFVTNNKITKH